MCVKLRSPLHGADTENYVSPGSTAGRAVGNILPWQIARMELATGLLS